MAFPRCIARPKRCRNQKAPEGPKWPQRNGIQCLGLCCLSFPVCTYRLECYRLKLEAPGLITILLTFASFRFVGCWSCRHVTDGQIIWSTANVSTNVQSKQRLLPFRKRSVVISSSRLPSPLCVPTSSNKKGMLAFFKALLTMSAETAFTRKTVQTRLIETSITISDVWFTDNRTHSSVRIKLYTYSGHRHSIQPQTSLYLRSRFQSSTRNLICYRQQRVESYLNQGEHPGSFFFSRLD